MIITLGHSKRVNIGELTDAILAAAPKATGVKVLAEPRTETINGAVVYKGYDLEVDGEIESADEAAISVAAAAHTPAETTAEQREAERLASRLVEFADIIAEAVRQAKDGK